MTVLPALLFGAAAFLLTLGLWPTRPPPPLPLPNFVEDPRVPRTLH